MMAIQDLLCMIEVVWYVFVCEGEAVLELGEIRTEGYEVENM